MANNIDRILNLDIQIINNRLSQTGFGRAAIFVEHSLYADRTRIYTDADDMLDDGFLTTDQAYIDARAHMAQTPSPEDFMIAKRDAAQAQVTRVNVDTVTPSFLYEFDLTISGIAFNIAYTSGALDTAADIRDGLISAVNASGAPVTPAIFDADTLSLTADTPGVSFVVSGMVAELSQTVGTANYGIAEDIDLAREENDDFYGVLLAERDDDIAYEAAVKVQTLRKLLMVQSSDDDIINTVYDPPPDFDDDDDLAAKVKFANLFRTSVLYVSDDSNPVAAAWMGTCICQIPGKITWKFKELTLCTPEADSVFDGQGYTNLTARSANGFFTVGGRNITFEGTVASGEFIDIIHGVDHLYSLVQRNVVLALIKQTSKVGMTQGGLDTIAAAVSAAMYEKMNDGLIAKSRVLSDGSTQVPGFTVTPPRIQDLSPSERAAREIPASHPIEAEGTLEGAIHFVDVDITVSV